MVFDGGSTDGMKMVVGSSVGWDPYGGLFQWNGVCWNTVMVCTAGRKRFVSELGRLGAGYG